ncbi:MULTISPECIES: NAD-dependent epimerase/dehydratase family protein [Oceanospirillaceae]|uniref:NAD-dependent epimerase/dehydratase family protein n=1 Tax=Oceanobacter antarcticus TaxID=3133425 RepID=A0ABW8NF50_9GAMM|tara:strand:+ start:285 stop:1250 length:966 start_codon:yes stop_codon:yes gene_type:complete
MHIVITGANGFVGKALAQRLCGMGTLGSRTITRLTLLDLSFDNVLSGDVAVSQRSGSIADQDWLVSQFPASDTMDVVFHLASIPGGMAETHYELSRAVNLDATQTLLELGQTQQQAGGPAPIFVFASSIAIFGTMDGPVSDDTPARPLMTYGAQKRIGEILLEDFSRRGWVDGRSLRLPGVLARPPANTGQLSAFMSDIIRELAAGRPFVCPTAAAATIWASSLTNVIDNLIHGAVVPAQQLAGQRTFTLPTQVCTMEALAQAVGRVYQVPAMELVQFSPNKRIETLFGRFPPLLSGHADTAGFKADANLDALVRDALLTA